MATNETFFHKPGHLKGFEYDKMLGDPGKFPFTRGIYPTMYKGRVWTMRQYAGFGTAEDTNKRYRYLLNAGLTGLSVAFDLPTQLGLDSDHPLAKPEIGKVGVAIDSLKDMEILFDGIDLEKVSCSMTINSTSGILLAMYAALAEKKGANLSKLMGTIQNDILKEYLVRGTYIFPPRESLAFIVDIFDFCKEKVPLWNPISISGYHIREAGSTASQEVAFTLADAITYAEAVRDAGYDLGPVLGRFSFFFNSHNDFFEEIAKFRAARRCWSGIVRSRFGFSDDSACQLRFHTQTGGSTLTAQQPLNNVVRVTLQALAAALGGTQSLHTNSFDEALALPTEDSVTLALRTQQIIAGESGITNSADPLGGSYYVEALTNRIEKEVFDYIDLLDKRGGVLKSIEDGFIQREIYKSSYDYQKSIEEGKRTLVGVNKFASDGEKAGEKIKLHQVSKNIAKRQLARLGQVRRERNNDAVKTALARIRETASKKRGITSAIFEAVKEYCTIGEICHVLKEVWGEYEPGGIV